MRILRHLSLVFAVAFVTTLTTPASSRAAFTHCTLGPYNGSGEWCLWQGASFSGNRLDYNVVGPVGPVYYYHDFGNRFNNRCIRIYANNNVLIGTARPNTGNAFSGGQVVFNSTATVCSM
jgi:hypothetical protein